MISKSSFVGLFLTDITETYSFVEELGSGAYGTVYRLRNISTSQIFACKKMNKFTISNKDRFKVEIELLKAMDHPYIVKLIEIYEDSTFLYLVMEECSGGELFKRLAQRSKENRLFTERETCHIFSKLMTAINYCHSHGISHRDIKPENILFSDNEDSSTLKVVDFGLSRIFSSENKTMTSIVGTSYYMAPEVLNGRYTEKCDVWSAGCILYIMLCGRPPFYSKNDLELSKKIKCKSYTFNYPEFLVISSDAKELITRMLCDEGSRMSAQEVLNHHWIKNLAPNSKESILDLKFDNIVNYAHMNKIKKGVFTFVATRLSNLEVQALIDIFNSFDKNRDGVITLKEAKSGIEYLKKNNRKDLTKWGDKIEQLFSDLDLDKNGLINYSEFLAASIDHKIMLTKDIMFQAFKAFDASGKGEISLENVVSIVRPNTKEDLEYLTDLFNCYDADGNGILNYDEFKRAIEV